MVASALIREPHDSTLCRASVPPLQTLRFRPDWAQGMTDASNDRLTHTEGGDHLQQRTPREGLGILVSLSRVVLIQLINSSLNPGFCHSWPNMLNKKQCVIK